MTLYTDEIPAISGFDTAFNRTFVMTGPCSVESREQIVETALRLHEEGCIDVLRGGIWKPRTRPGCFEGLGEKALPWLREAADRAGVPCATEVAVPEHVYAAISEGVDILWIGARTSVNPFAVQQLADAIAERNSDIPVLVKNPVNPDLELWIGAIQRLYNAGVKRIGAIHRGFSAYNTYPFRNLPMWQIPMEFHRRLPSVPLLHDPSHTGGSRELLQPLAQQALDLGFSGLMIESHIRPDEALSDGGQQIVPSDLSRLISSLVIKQSSVESTELDRLRTAIDECDDMLIESLARRMRLSEQIGRYKKLNGMKVLQPSRYQRLLSDFVEKATQQGLESEFVKRLLELIHEESVRLQLNIH